ncbi:MAG: B12-binding domain-containing radical SAM protein [Dehalococcoidales bacterium]|nr:B12-binding domain-containing radical SAM protein [Dehalococcoidales bacterium]
MAKVLFINPVIRQDDQPRHVPYGMALLVAIAEKAGHKVQVFDANAWRPADQVLKDALGADEWDLIATGGFITSYGYIKKVVKYAHHICPNSLIVAGGGFLTAIPHDIMKLLPEIDIGVVGEGFSTFPEILEKVDRKDYDWSGVKGIIWRDRGGHAHLNLERPLLEDLDSLPYPAWEAFPLNIYFRNSSLLLSEEAMLSRRRLDITASHGCPYGCCFCFHLGLSGELETVETPARREVIFTRKRKIRWHSPKYVASLAKYARQRFKVDFISILDENFIGLNRYTQGQWMTKFCDLWIKEGLQPHCTREGKPHDAKNCNGVHWGATAHVTLVDAQTLKRLREIGCSHLDYGLESFSDQILKSITKGATSEMNERAVKLTLEAGIRPVPNQIIGFPEESFDSIRANVLAWERLGIQTYPFLATPYPGSEWYFKYKRQILAQYNGNLEAFLLDLGDATKLTAVISNNFNGIELLGLRELMVNRDIRRINQYEQIWKKNRRSSR